MRKLVSVFLNIFIHLFSHPGYNQFPATAVTISCVVALLTLLRFCILVRSPYIASFHPQCTPSLSFLGSNSLSTSPLDSDILHQSPSPHRCLLNLIGLDIICQLMPAHGHTSCHNRFWHLALVLFLNRCRPHAAWALVALSRASHVCMPPSVILDSDSPYQAAR